MINKAYQYVSLDLWDTLLRRSCHPDEIKLFIAQYCLFRLAPYLQDPSLSAVELLHLRRDIEYRIGQRERTNGFDDEYEISEVINTLIGEITSDRLDDNSRKKLCEQIVEAEIRQEIAVTHLDHNLLNLLKTCSYEQVILTSDFYMSRNKIARILESKPLPFRLDALFISCDCKYNKRSGRLFEHICSTLQTAPATILHIGDNQETDVVMARKSGVSSIHFTEEQTSWSRRERSFAARLRGDNSLATCLCKIAMADSGSKMHGKGVAGAMYLEGVKMSPSFLGFALFIRQLCAARKHKRVYFCTREGIFFKKVFDCLQAHNPYNLEPVATYLLPVSRLATFFPSLQSISTKELTRMWSQYHTQSMHTLLGSLGLAYQDYQDHFTGHAIDPHNPIAEPWLNEKVQKLFDDQQFLDALQHAYQEQRQNLLTYFESLHFTDNGRALMVDIGWRGTIQDNIATTFNTTMVDGAYLGLQKFFNVQPDNVRKYSFLANANNSDSHPTLYHVMPAEMLCFSPGGSATGYRKDHDGIHPVYQRDQEEEDFFAQWIAPFQQGVLSGTAALCGTVGQKGISTTELQAIARNQFAQLIEAPPPILCRAFFSLKQDDTFGMNRVIYPGRGGYRLRDKILGYVLPAREKEFMRSLEESGWPQALLRLQYGGLLYRLGALKRKIYS